MQTTENQSRPITAHKNSTPNSRLLEIKRNFDVPVTRLFQAFTTPNELKTWWWPKGLYADRIDIDLSEGGEYFINMKGFEKGGGGITGQFLEVVKNERIVMSDYFADENGSAISAEEAKMPGAWPEVVYITFDFDEASGSTSRLRLAQEGIPNEMQKDCVQGWNEMFDKLENYLSGQKQ
jgi:uncharacterized protein YndB with AHSA1/START domain